MKTSASKKSSVSRISKTSLSVYLATTTKKNCRNGRNYIKHHPYTFVPTAPSKGAQTDRKNIYYT